MNYYDEIKDELINNEINKKIKDYSKNKYELERYYNVGKLLSEAGKHYGEGIIKKYSILLSSDVEKKYNVTTLKRIRQFYWIIEKGATLSHKLSWSHYIELIPLNTIEIINYYVSIIDNYNLSIRQLRNRIRNKEYERLPIETKSKLNNKSKVVVKDLVPNPILIKNKNNLEIVTEKVLHRLILEDISSFLRELGSGFTFIDSEYKIKIGNIYNYIDLLLFNIEFNCYVVVELKVTELKKEHIGQIEIYMNYIDKNLKKIVHDKTIGIIICKKENKYVIEYCSDERIIARKYEII